MSPSVQYYIEVQQHRLPGWLYLVSCFIITIIDQAQKKLGIKGDICEIRIFEGKTLALLGLLASNEETCVGLDIEVRAGLHANLGRIFSDKYPFLIEQRNSLDLDAAGVLQFSPLGGYRLFHVDGHHTFENALNDLRLAVESLNPGGVIFLDDFYSPTVPGVTEALHHLVEKDLNCGIVPFAMGGAKVYLCHEEYVELYRSSLFENMPMPSKSHPEVGILFGRTIAIYDLYPAYLETSGVSIGKLERVKSKLRLKEDELRLKKVEIQSLQKELKKARSEINAMKSSKFWKIREVYVGLKEKLRLST